MSNVTLDLLLTPSDHDAIDSVADQVELGEGLGFERVSMGEVTGRDAVSTLAVIADRTDRIGISNDVFSPYSRSPSLLAQTALTLDEISDGRYRLGLGTSSPNVVEGWHGVGFDRPLRRLREAIEIINTVYEGERAKYDGELFELGGLQYDHAVPENPPGIDIAVLGPKAVELTGRFADGWVPQLFTTEGLTDRMDDLHRGAELGNRDPEALHVAPILRCCALEDRERARSLARRTVAFLIGAYGPYYRQSVKEQGYEDVADAIHEAWQDRDTEAMAARLPDEVLDEFAAAGTPEEVRERVRAFGAVEGVDSVRVGFQFGQTIDEQNSTMEALSELL
jgi:coenzyme F420-dependent oxidoreductase